MLQTIQVEIDATGHIHPMEALSFKPVGRALLTLLDTPTETMSLQIYEGRGSIARALSSHAKVIWSFLPTLLRISNTRFFK